MMTKLRAFPQEKKKIDFLAVPVDTIITSPCPAVQIYQLLTLLVHDQQLKQTKLSQTI